MFDRRLLCMLCVAIMIGTAPFLVAQSSTTTQSESDQSQQQDQSQQMGLPTSSPMSSQMGSRDEIRQLQQALKNEGFDPGPADGIMGRRTRAALRQYQQKNNLQATGELNSETRAALGLTGSTETSGRASSTPGQTDRDTSARPSSTGSDTMTRSRETDTTTGTAGTTSSTTGATASAGTTTDQAGAKDDDEDSGDQAELARKAAEVLTEITSAPDKGIPEELLRRAKGIAVIPSVIKGAFGIGGRWGEGLLSGRNPDGTWGAPSYIEISGASVGFQIGVSSTDVVLVLTSKDAIDALLKGKVKLGADAAVAAGPVGRTGSVGTDVRFEGPIYSYSRSKGLFAGVALDGAVISIDDSANRKAYGENVSGTDILANNKVQANATVQPFLEAVRTHTPARAE